MLLHVFHVYVPSKPDPPDLPHVIAWVKFLIFFVTVCNLELKCYHILHASIRMLIQNERFMSSS